MITLKNSLFENPQMVVQTLSKVYNCSDYPSTKSAYKIKRMCDLTSKVMSEYLTEMNKLKNEKDPELLKDIPNKLKELNEKENEVKFGPMTEEEFSVLKFSPAELTIIEPFVDPKAFSSLQ